MKINWGKVLTPIYGVMVVVMVTIGVYPEPIIQFAEFATPAINMGFTP